MIIDQPQKKKGLEILKEVDDYVINVICELLSPNITFAMIITFDWFINFIPV